MSQPTEIHLLVCVHGMWGNPADLSAIAETIRTAYPPESTPLGSPQLHVLVATANKGNFTYDGIDWGSERVADEILKEVKTLEEDGRSKVTRFSMVGYSLGGLIARYVVGILHIQSFFTTIAPVNFYTFATPHIGLPRYPSFISSVTTTFGPKLLSRTGEQFYGVDVWGTTGKPLLEAMADPTGVFYEGLMRFRRINIYASAAHDITVPYVTAAIETTDPFFAYEKNGLQINYNPKYPHLIDSWSFPPTPPTPISRLSAAYVRSLVPSRPFLPPFLHMRFPLNILLFIVLPLLIPVLIVMLLVRFTRATRESRARIKSLETHESAGSRLVNILRNAEANVESAVENALGVGHSDKPESRDLLSPTPPNGSSNGKGKLISVSSSSSITDDGDGGSSDLPRPAAATHAAAAGEQPILTPSQQRTAAALNTIPHLQKHLVLIHGVRNAHGAIICRNAAMNQGRDVLRHWADNFVL